MNLSVYTCRRTMVLCGKGCLLRIRTEPLLRRSTGLERPSVQSLEGKQVAVQFSLAAEAKLGEHLSLATPKGEKRALRLRKSTKQAKRAYFRNR
jgi:hypothetical protein